MVEGWSFGLAAPRKGVVGLGEGWVENGVCGRGVLGKVARLCPLSGFHLALFRCVALRGARGGRIHGSWGA